LSSPISGFTAIPNPQMLAFMGAQSFIMMFQAGEGWQYGKRRISAMSNEEFNKLTPERILQNQAANLRASIPTIQKSMDDMTPMIRTIIAQYGDFLREAIAAAPQAIANVFQPSGTGGGHDESQGALSPSPGVASFLAPVIPNIQQLKEIQEAHNAVHSKEEFLSIQEVKDMIAAGQTNQFKFGQSVTHNILPKQTSRGILGGPAPKATLAQTVRTSLARRNVQENQLRKMQRDLLLTKRDVTRFFTQLSRSSGQTRTNLLTQVRLARNKVSRLEREIVLFKLQMSRNTRSRSSQFG